MTKASDGNSTSDAQDSLVQALESIKGLLEKSESSLSQARESIALANSSSKKARLSSEPEDIPVLSEVIMPSHEVITQPDFDVFSTPAAQAAVSEPEIPVLEEIPTLGEDIPTLGDDIPTLGESFSAGMDSQQVIELINDFQLRIQPQFKETISNCSLLKLEEELNKIVENELMLLRAQIKQLDN